MPYNAVQEQHPDRQSGSFDCRLCKTQVHSWSGDFGYSHWEAIEMEPVGRGRLR
jgi:hypothetical protein